MSAQEERVSLRDITSVLDEANDAVREFEFEKFEERLNYARAIQRKFRNQEGDL